VEELKKDNIDLKIEFVLGGDKDSVQILKDTAEFFGTSAEYVIVRNKGRAANFKILDGSKTKQTLLEGLDAKVIELKKLCEETASSMDAANCNFSEARDCIKLYTFARMRVDSYFRETIEMFDEKGLTWS